MMKSSEYMTVYRNQIILHTNNWKYHSNYSLNEVVRNLKYLQGKSRHDNLAKISENPRNFTKHYSFS